LNFLLVGDNQLCVFVEEVGFLHIKIKSDGIASLGGCMRLNTCGNLCAVNVEVQEYFRAQKLIYLNCGRHCAVRSICNVFGTDTHNNSLADVAAVFQSFCLGIRDSNFVRTDLSNELAAFFLDHCIQEVHLRGSHESCYEQVARFLIQILRSIYLLNNAVFHNNDPCTKGHSLCLVMCYVGNGSSQSLMDLGDLDTHLYTKFRIQVGKRLVPNEYLGIAHRSTYHGLM